MGDVWISEHRHWIKCRRNKIRHTETPPPVNLCAWLPLSWLPWWRHLVEVYPETSPAQNGTQDQCHPQFGPRFYHLIHNGFDLLYEMNSSTKCDLIKCRLWNGTIAVFCLLWNIDTDKCDHLPQLASIISASPWAGMAASRVLGVFRHDLAQVDKQGLARRRWIRPFWATKQPAVQHFATWFCLDLWEYQTEVNIAEKLERINNKLTGSNRQQKIASQWKPCFARGKRSKIANARTKILAQNMSGPTSSMRNSIQSPS